MSRRQKRQRFIHWLRSFLVPMKPSLPYGNRSIRVERLEGRSLMAADVLAPFLGSANPGHSLVGEGEAGLVAEGEPAADLVAFAKALRDSGTQMFGAYWCPHCLTQKQLFQDGAQFLPYVEVTDNKRNPNSIATTENITSYPTWQFPNGTRLVGEQTLETLSTRSGVAIPQASKPSFTTIPNASVEFGAPFHVPVDAFDPNGNPLTVTVSSSNSNVVNAQVLSGNRSMRIRVKDFGDMVFQLYETEAPIPTSRIIELATAGFYSNIKFHRILNNFVIQAGDPQGTGSGGSTLGDINDQFNVNLQHTRTGILSYAKTAVDDTGDSQFFVTEGQARHLDFNHAVFGQMIEGEAVRDAISNVFTDSSGVASIDVVIESVTIFTDTENALVRLTAGASSGTANITVTVADTEGNTTSQTFVATATPDAANGAPFLNAIPNVSTSVNTPVTINLTSQDAENNPVTYSVEKVGNQNYTVTVGASTGVVTFTPPTGFTGTLQFRAKVQQSTTPTTQDPIDSQLVTVVVSGGVPTAIDLNGVSDSGSSNADDVTNATTPTFTVSGTQSGALVKLKVGNTVIGQATASGATTTITANDVSTLGQGAVLVVATQTIGGVESGVSPSLSVTFDTVAPINVATNLIPTSTQVGQALSVNLAHAEEGQGLIYSLENAPVGMTIDASTGALAWTPTQALLGAQAFNLKLTDRAGNVRTQPFSINVIEQPQAKIILQPVDMQGNPISQVANGQQFKVRFLAQDLRGFGASGVFSAYIDLLFDANIVEPIATNAISHTAPYTNGASPTPSTPTIAGVINELGAFSTSFSRGNGDPVLIAEVTFTAKAAGNANIRSEAADVNGNDILLFDASDKIPSSKVDYGSADLAVGANFQVVNDVFNFDEDTPVHSLNVLSNDTVTGGAVLTISAVGPITGGAGTVTIAPDGKSLNYTSGPNFNGAQTFTYTVRNADNVSLTGTVTVQVADVNDPPIAANDVFEVVTGSTVNVLSVLTNDTTGNDAATSETLRVSAVGTPTGGGTVQLGSSGLNILYTPRSGFVGTDTVTYTLSDSRGGTATATASITVKQSNPPPVAATDNFTVVEDAAQADFDPLVNDTTDVGETLSISGVSPSTRGSLFAVTSDGKKVSYRPGLNLAGSEVLTYTLRDSGGATSTGTITFSITAVNDAPNAVNDNLSALSSAGAQTLNVLTNDANPDSGETATISAVTQPASGQGSVAISADKKSILYTPPNASFTGTVSFTYTLSDGSALTDTATVTLTVSNFVPRDFEANLIRLDGGSGTDSLFAYGGVELRVTGTDITGAVQNYTLDSNTNGSFLRSNIAPGTYTVSRDPLPFLDDTGLSMTVTSAAADTSKVTVNSPVGGLKSQFLSIRDFLGSVSNSITLAVKPGSNESWYALRGGYAGYSNIQARLNAASTSLTVTAVDNTNRNVSTNLPIGGTDSRINVLAADGGAQLLRIRGAATDLGFQSVTASSLSGSGEGEQVAPTPRQSLVAEGEATPTIASQSEIVPAVNTGGLTPTQALRRLLGSAQTNSLSPNTSALVSATTHLSSSAVDSALTDIDTLTLSEDEIDAITRQEIGTYDHIDSALLGM